MSDPDTSGGFLRARLDEDERVAREVGELDSTARNGIESTAGYGALQLVEHFGPDRQLREVAAKRRILDWLDEVDRFMDRDDMSWHRLAGEADTDNARRLLALPYADHPDYREEWKP